MSGRAVAVERLSRSQYGYPVRVSLELALENRHRAPPPPSTR